jgi:hypothetical protein
MFGSVESLRAHRFSLTLQALRAVGSRRKLGDTGDNFKVEAEPHTLRNCFAVRCVLTEFRVTVGHVSVAMPDPEAQQVLRAALLSQMRDAEAPERMGIRPSAGPCWQGWGGRLWRRMFDCQSALPIKESTLCCWFRNAYGHSTRGWTVWQTTGESWIASIPLQTASC